MATFTIVVRECNERRDGKFPVAIRVTQNRVSKNIPTDAYLTRKQIKPDFSGIKDTTVLKGLLNDIANYEEMLAKGLGTDLSRFTVTDLVNYIKAQKQSAGGTGIDFIAFAKAYIQDLKDAGRTGYAEPFDAIIRNLIDFFGRPFVSIKEINVKNLLAFAEYMQKPHVIRRTNQLGKVTEYKKNGVKPQTIKDYLGDIQTLFKAACEKYNDEDAEIVIISHNPFASKKLHIEIKDEPQKRDLAVEDLIKILKAETVPGRRMQLARDVLALSFYLMAANTADLYGEDAKINIRRIEYHRQKTSTRRKDKAFLSVKIEPEALPLLRKYYDPEKKRLFSFYKMYGTSKYFNKNVNKGCEQLAKYLGITADLTTYYVRHTLATIASEDCGISEAEIALMLDHVGIDNDMEENKRLKVTRGYIHRRFTKNDINFRRVLDFINNQK